MNDFWVRYLIRFDGLAGLLAGCSSLMLSNFLVELYELPRWMVLANAAVNIGYGVFSTTLASMKRRPLGLVTGLSLANCFWAVLCFAAVYPLAVSATPFAVGHALFEGVFVGTLGIVEWRMRKRLATA